MSKESFEKIMEYVLEPRWSSIFKPEDYVIPRETFAPVGFPSNEELNASINEAVRLINEGNAPNYLGVCTDAIAAEDLNADVYGVWARMLDGGKLSFPCVGHVEDDDLSEYELGVQAERERCVALCMAMAEEFGELTRTAEVARMLAARIQEVEE